MSRMNFAAFEVVTLSEERRPQPTPTQPTPTQPTPTQPPPTTSTPKPPEQPQEAPGVPLGKDPTIVSPED
jgi:cell division septation protein DedD